MPKDLIAAVAGIAADRLSARDAIEASIAAADSAANAHSFIRRFDAQAREAAEAVDRDLAAGAPLRPLAGLAVSIKDLFDVQGQPTTAASKSMRDAAPAAADCPAVARLRHAGAALIAHTNLTEFAFSGVGINPHHGTPVNPVTAALDPTPRIPGGSTSGGAVSVATGAAWAALGSDTGGSIRIPAALQGLVGFKNTQALTPLAGCIPLAPSLDTACAITRSVRDAVLVHEILADRHVALQRRPLAGWRLAVPTTSVLDGLDETVARAFERTLGALSRAGAALHELPVPELAQLAPLQAGGGLAAAESWAWHRERLALHEADYDPRVAQRIRRGKAISPAALAELHRARRDWIERVQARVRGFDALLTPTVPIVAPPLAPLVADDDAFFAANALLLRNASIVNQLDGCALSLPCHRAGDMPAGLMVWHTANRDDSVLSISLALERALEAAS
jgi:amidase/aspartyl-tRNA(Asn)/glutamyl-tRNA(Gln) amidotransferase subunit A